MDLFLSAPAEQGLTRSCFRGIFPAVITPFACDGSLDTGRLDGFLSHLYNAGVDGVYVCGNAGEWHAQTLDERKLVAEVAVAASRGRGKVIVHVGAATTQDAISLARHAAEIGVDAVSSLPPYIARWSTQEIEYYYLRLFSATGLPCFVYYYPALTGGLCSEDFVRLIHRLPCLAGVKFTDMNLYELGLVAGQGPDGFSILNGHDQVLLAALVMGATGGIGAFYNVMPERFVALYRNYCNGDVAGAQATQTTINRVIRAAKKYRLLPALRFLAKLRGTDVGQSREPTLMLAPKEQRDLENDLAETGFA